MTKLLSILTLAAIAVIGGCGVARNPVGPSVETPTRRQPEPAAQIDVPEAEVVAPESTAPVAVDPAPVAEAPAEPPIVNGVPYTCEFHEDACFYPDAPPPPAPPGWVYRDCEEQGLTSTPTGCGEAIGDAPPGVPIRD